MPTKTEEPRLRRTSLNIRISDTERKRFKKAADKAGVSVSAWIRDLARSKAGMKKQR